MKTLLILSLVLISSISIAQESTKVEPIVWQFKKGKTTGYIFLTSKMIKEDELVPKDVFDKVTNWGIDYFLVNAIKPEYGESKLRDVFMQDIDYSEFYTKEEIEILTKVLKQKMIIDDRELLNDTVAKEIKEFPPIAYCELMEEYICDIGDKYTCMNLKLYAIDKKIELIPYIGYRLELEQIEFPIREQIDILFDLYANKETVFEMASKKRAGYLSGDIVNWKIEDVTQAKAKDIKSATELMADFISKGAVLISIDEEYMFHENGINNWLLSNGFKLKRISF